MRKAIVASGLADCLAFQIRSMLVATGHEMEALEITSDGQLGYCFRVLADGETDAWKLFRKLYATMRREMAQCYVERTEHGWQIAPDQHVRGRIDWDPETNGRLPLIVIDGKPFTWEQRGSCASMRNFTRPAAGRA
jgi:hypothetical protein